MRGSIGGVLTRVITVIAVLALVGITLKLIVAILTPILPAQFMAALSAGESQLYGLVAPAIAPIGALAILALLVWIITSSRR